MDTWQNPLRSGEVVVSFCIPSEDGKGTSCYCFLGDVRQSTPIGGSFWQVGVEFTEFANRERWSQVEAFAEMSCTLLDSTTKPAAQTDTNE